MINLSLYPTYFGPMPWTSRRRQRGGYGQVGVDRCGHGQTGVDKDMNALRLNVLVC